MAPPLHAWPGSAGPTRRLFDGFGAVVRAMWKRRWCPDGTFCHFTEHGLGREAAPDSIRDHCTVCGRRGEWIRVVWS